MYSKFTEGMKSALISLNAHISTYVGIGYNCKKTVVSERPDVRYMKEILKNKHM